MEQLLALEMVRVTEEAAIASARAMGRGDRHGADRPATEAMRPTMDEIDFAGRIVIGEGERDEAPMLYIGEEVGRRGARAICREVDIAVDPLEGTNLVAHGQAGAITVLAASEARRPDPRPGHVPREAVRRPSGRRARSTSARPPPRTSGGSRRRSAGGSATSRWSSSSGRATTTSSPRSATPAPASSSSATATCRPPSRCAVSGTGVHAVMGIGGAPEGVHHRGRAALPRRRDPGALPLPQRRRARARRADGPRRRGRGSTGPRTSRPARTSCSPRPASRRATCSRASASSAAARGRTRW